MCVVYQALCLGICVFFFNDTATTEIYTLSLHDALPISQVEVMNTDAEGRIVMADALAYAKKYNPKLVMDLDRKSTRLNSSHPSRSRMPSSA